MDSISNIIVGVLLMSCRIVRHEDPSLLCSNQNNNAMANTAVMENLTAQMVCIFDQVLLLLLI